MYLMRRGTVKDSNTYVDIKKRLAEEALTLISEDMIVGLGSGSTAQEFIRLLGSKVREENLSIQAVASSQASYDLACQLKIPLLHDQTFSYTDLVVDGADEVDPQMRMIKGGGGALFREKILIQSSRRCVILVDESKRVDLLGRFPLPIEISAFGCMSVVDHLRMLGYQGSWRLSLDGQRFLTDNGNYIYDLFPNSYLYPEKDLLCLSQIHGVIEVGFVIEKVEVWTGYIDGKIDKNS